MRADRVESHAHASSVRRQCWGAEVSPVPAASVGVLRCPDIISRKGLPWVQHRDSTCSAACSANIYQHHLNVIYSCIPKEGCGRLGSFDN